MSKTYLFFEAEIDGFPSIHPVRDIRYPRIVKLTWAVFDEDGTLLKIHDHLIHRTGGVKKQTFKLTGINDQLLKIQGEERDEVYSLFFNDLKTADYIISYDLEFELKILENEIGEWGVNEHFLDSKKRCLKLIGTSAIELSKQENEFEMSFNRLHQFLFEEPFIDRRTPYSEVFAMARCYFEIEK